MPLTDAKIRNAKPTEKPLKLTDGSGLYLEVRLSGSKLWRYRYRIAGRENVYAVGKFCQAPPGESNAEQNNRKISGQFTLAEARQERDRCQGLVKLGIHPAHNRKAQRAVYCRTVGVPKGCIARPVAHPNVVYCKRVGYPKGCVVR
jgi:Arm DNA-binding domain